MTRKIIPYNNKLKPLARKLRNDSTLSEVLLWNYLKGRQMKNYDFHRQKPLLNFIVDFFCHELMLVIEIDGESHNDKYEEDIFRQKELEGIGLQFLRFDDIEVKKNMDNVLRTIDGWIEEHDLKKTHPSVAVRLR